MADPNQGSKWGPEAAWNRVQSYPELYDPTVMTERSHQNGVDPRISGFQDSLENSREPFSIQFSSVVHINFRTVGKFRTAGARCVVMKGGVGGVSRGSRHSRHPSVLPGLCVCTTLALESLSRSIARSIAPSLED